MSDHTDYTERALARLSAALPEETISKLAAEYSGLQIEGAEDKEGYIAVSNARKHIKTLRNKVERRRKELKADALAFSRAVDGRARELKEQLEPIEGGLQKKVTAYLEAVRLEMLRKERQDALPGRREALAEYGESLTDAELLEMEDVQFSQLVANLQKRKYEMEMAEVKKQARIERERIEAERKALEDERRQIEQQRDDLAAMRADYTLEDEPQTSLFDVPPDAPLSFGSNGLPDAEKTFKDYVPESTGWKIQKNGLYLEPDLPALAMQCNLQTGVKKLDALTVIQWLISSGIVQLVPYEPTEPEDDENEFFPEQDFDFGF